MQDERRETRDERTDWVSSVAASGISVSAARLSPQLHLISSLPLVSFSSHRGCVTRARVPCVSNILFSSLPSSCPSASQPTVSSKNEVSRDARSPFRSDSREGRLCAWEICFFHILRGFTTRLTLRMKFGQEVCAQCVHELNRLSVRDCDLLPWIS